MQNVPVGKRANNKFFNTYKCKSFGLSVFWPFDWEIQINELMFSDSVSLSFKTRLTSVICFWGDVTLSKFQPWNQRLNFTENMMM